MTPQQRFPEAFFKLARGRQLTDQLNQLIATQVRGAYEFNEHREPGDDMYSFRAKLIGAYDEPAIALLIGDVLNNLKSGLDYAIWSLIREREAAGIVTGKCNPKSVGFTTHDEASEYSLRVKQQAQIAGAETVALVTTLDATPKGDGSVIWQLATLNNLDKLGSCSPRWWP